MSLSKQKSLFPFWLKLSAAIYLAVFISVYWVLRGPANFLWFSDIALIVIVITLWLEKPLPASMMAVGVLLFELGWILDFLFRLIMGHHLFGLNATRYMFTPELPFVIKLLSFSLHVILPVLLVYVFHKLGYDRCAWKAQTILAWIVLPVCYFFTDPALNINWVFGIGGQQTLATGPVYLISGMIVLSFLVYYPVHRLLIWIFYRIGNNMAKELVYSPALLRLVIV